ncbi:hypothetical protein SS50377_24213 [Spironucleus salmonicida]|uniref:Cysteine-rich protein n=1 Tax=Spironucleus salmonicida TaxID=348837 RepID=V6M3J6_9EUKA|nr:hypothetical protein SS50377_24213 [Spironucleus salmonicida]|eukprot:EST47864.1 hypothetical protein SS50377_12055 [Spironucleus salmonicida]
MKGFSLDQGNCIANTNIYDQHGNSSTCHTGFFCDSNSGNLCTSCSKITHNKTYKCTENLIKNCIQCDSQKSYCVKCIEGYELVFDHCVKRRCGFFQTLKTALMAFIVKKTHNKMLFALNVMENKNDIVAMLKDAILVDSGNIHVLLVYQVYI